MFESLPEFSKFKKMCDDKIKEEEAKTKQTEQQNDDEFAPGKWRMKFAKDERQTDPKQKSSAKQQFGFGYESEEEDPARNFQGHALTQLINYNAPSTSTYDKNKKQRSPERAKPKQEVPPVPAVPIVSKGAVVLDKFGNFRLADPVALPKLPESSRRSRSKSRRRDSRSRSDSRHDFNLHDFFFVSFFSRFLNKSIILGHHVIDDVIQDQPQRVIHAVVLDHRAPDIIVISEEAVQASPIVISAIVP